METSYVCCTWNDLIVKFQVLEIDPNLFVNVLKSDACTALDISMNWSFMETSQFESTAGFN